MAAPRRWTQRVDPVVRDWWPVALVLVLVQLGPDMESAQRQSAVTVTLFGLAHSLPLRWRRGRPLAVLSVIVGAVTVQVLFTTLPLQFGSFVAVMIAAFSAGSYARLRPAVAGLVVTLAVVAGTGLLDQPTAPEEFVFPVVYIGGAWALGRAARHRRRTTDHLAALTEQLHAERDERIRLALLAERAHVAREVHDIVAHSLGVVVLQAEAAASVLAEDSPAQRPVQVIQDTGREALDEVRRLLGLLREGDEARLPQPRLEALTELVAQFSAGGLLVDLTVNGNAERQLPADLELSVYRIVQEALTNALKHGRATTATVRIDIGADAVDVSVVDNGTASQLTGDGGFGIAGMRERVALFGGELAARGRDGGGFAVEAHLPLAAT